MKFDLTRVSKGSIFEILSNIKTSKAIVRDRMLTWYHKDGSNVSTKPISKLSFLSVSLGKSLDC